MTQTTNPLGQYFRKPGLNVKLPSGGQFYKTPPKVSVDGEIAVYPMTAKDELLVKNADSLLNGDALVNLIRSCVPDIADPKEMPNPDVDAVLLAIRKATYGEKLEITTTCPCQEWNGTYSISVDQMLIKIKDIAARNEVELDNNIIVQLKPSTLSDQNKLGLVQFENVRMLQAVQDADEERKIKASADVTVRNIQLAAEIISGSIVGVLTPDGQEVTDNAAIREWLSQLEATEYKKIEDVMRIINDSGAETKIEVMCGKEGCDRKFEVEFTLDPVSFFAPGS